MCLFTAAEEGECVEEDILSGEDKAIEAGSASTSAKRALSWQWGKKMRRLRQEMDQVVLWGTESTQIVDGEAVSWTPKSLAQSEAFSMRLTDLLCASAESSASGNCAEEDEELEAKGGIYVVLSRVLGAGEIMDSQIKDLCSLWFG
jgi:hypothetical protein